MKLGMYSVYIFTFEIWSLPETMVDAGIWSVSGTSQHSIQGFYLQVSPCHGSMALSVGLLHASYGLTQEKDRNPGSEQVHSNANSYVFCVVSLVNKLFVLY